MCKPTSDDEQAVSIDTVGPFKRKLYAMRPEVTLRAVPVAEYAETPRVAAEASLA